MVKNIEIIRYKEPITAFGSADVFKTQIRYWPFIYSNTISFNKLALQQAFDFKFKKIQIIESAYFLNLFRISFVSSSLFLILL